MQTHELDPGLVPASEPCHPDATPLLADVARCLQAQLAGVDGGAMVRLTLRAVASDESSTLQLVALLLVRPRAIARAWHARERDDHAYRRLVDRLHALPRALPFSLACVGNRFVHRVDLAALPAAFVRRVGRDLDDLGVAFDRALDVVAQRYATRLSRPQVAARRHMRRMPAQPAGAAS